MTSAPHPVIRTTDEVIRNTSERRRTGSVVWHVGALVVLAVVLYPVIWVVGASVKPRASARWSVARSCVSA